MIPSNSELRKLVRAGIARLDELGPDDWRARVDSNKLRVGSLTNCPIAQIYGIPGEYVPGAFSEAMVQLDIECAEEYGFAVPIRENIGDHDRDIASRLDEIWREDFS